MSNLLDILNFNILFLIFLYVKNIDIVFIYFFKYLNEKMNLKKLLKCIYKSNNRELIDYISKTTKFL